KARDKIVKINGEPTRNKTPLDAVKLLRGEKGTKVTISIYREGEKELRDITLTRDTIPLHSVKSYEFMPGFGYISISNFQNNTTMEFKQALDTLQQKGQLKGLVLDLRNNPGGLLSQAVSIADIFLKKGLIVYTRGRNKKQDITYEAHQTGPSLSCPMVVLVNEGSASASEIVAGAVQDHQRAVIVGTNTFGKGSVQTVIPLRNGAGLRMTTARYYTPKGRSIQATGIVPDVEVASLAYVKPDTDKTEKDFFRETDLSNHFNNENGSEDTGTSAVTKGIQKKLEKDNQLRTAFNILKSLVLYTSYRRDEAP
ncbi:MAG: peptidase S41, partial [Proteobacteria bacterium]